MYAVGFIVVRRAWQGPTNKGRRTRGLAKGWTLHRVGCKYAERAKYPLPAPAVPYAGTVPCHQCQPNAERDSNGSE